MSKMQVYIYTYMLHTKGERAPLGQEIQWWRGGFMIEKRKNPTSIIFYGQERKAQEHGNLFNFFILSFHFISIHLLSFAIFGTLLLSTHICGVSLDLWQITTSFCEHLSYGWYIFWLNVLHCYYLLYTDATLLKISSFYLCTYSVSSTIILLY